MSTHSPPATARLAAAAPAFVERASPGELDDWLSYFEPDAVLLTGESAAPRAASALRRRTPADTPVLQPSGTAPASGPRTIGGVQFVLAPTPGDLRAIPDHEGDAVDPAAPAFVVGDRLALDVDTTALSASLAGREAYAAALGEPAGEYVHLSTRLPAGYRREWDGLTVVGAGAGAGGGERPLAALDCRADGRTLVRTLAPDNLGLRALDGVGTKRARRLSEAGFGSRAAVADAERSALTEIEGIGGPTAGRIRRSARAIARGEVVRASEAPLPCADPLFVDLETDGLSPTVTWLVGVLDGAAADGTYRSFLQRDPDDPGGAIAAFLSWYETAGEGRPLVAYGGRNFDFEVLDEHVAEHCPGYGDVWRGIDRFDPYHWAVERDNAALPGRTNGLADVAAALGHERDGPDLTGAAVARAYRRWAADRSPASEVDWERFDAYCEDDVRALARVHGALAASGRVGESRTVAETTTQGRLSEW